MSESAYLNWTEGMGSILRPGSTVEPRLCEPYRTYIIGLDKREVRIDGVASEVTIGRVYGGRQFSILLSCHSIFCLYAVNAIENLKRESYNYI